MLKFMVYTGLLA